MATLGSKGKTRRKVTKANVDANGRFVTLSFFVPEVGKAASKHVTNSSRLLSVLRREISAPGVILKAIPGVPLYRADSDPRYVVRRLNGKTVRGRLSGGKFTSKL